MQACYIPVHPLTAAGVIVAYSCKEGPALGQLPLIAVWGTIQIIMTVLSDVERVSSKTAPRYIERPISSISWCTPALVNIKSWL